MSIAVTEAAKITIGRIQPQSAARCRLATERATTGFIVAALVGGAPRAAWSGCGGDAMTLVIKETPSPYRDARLLPSCVGGPCGVSPASESDVVADDRGGDYRRKGRPVASRPSTRLVVIGVASPGLSCLRGALTHCASVGWV